MANISFSWTAPAINALRKTCTRREWDDKYARQFRAGTRHIGWSRSARFGGRRICIIELTRDAYKEPTRLAPHSDWEAEGFAYLEEIGAKVNGQLPAELWHHWLNSDQELYVVRFKIIELIKEGGKQNARYNRVKYRY